MKREINITTQHLPVVLTDAELLAMGKQQADKSLAWAALEADRKRTADNFKARQSAIEAEASVLASQISCGYIYRDVPCTEYLGEPEPGQKRVVRDDTLEVVSIERMTAAEMQRLLPLEPAPGEVVTDTGTPGTENPANN